MKLKMTACIEASKEEVWKILSDVTNVSLWIAPILSARCEGDQKRGIGTERICQLKGNMTINEKWIEWSEEVSYT